MKTTIFTLILFAMSGFTGFCQQILNGDFENWSIDTLYEEPVSFGTTNLQSFFATGSPNVLKSTDSQNGTFAAHLVTEPGTPNPVTGALFIGTPGQGGINGGIPYSEKPVALQGYCKFNILPNDTANIIVFLKRTGNIMAVAILKPTGTQLSYTQFSTPFIWIDTVSAHFPDTLVALISSSNFNNPVAGSEMYIDNLVLTGVTLPFPNGDFENWITTSYENPDSWTTLNFFGFLSGNISATKTTDHYGAGNYALKFQSITVPNGTGSVDTMGMVTNGRLGNNGPEGGMKVNNYPKRVSGYYKYIPVGPDTALAGMFLYGNNIMLDSALIQLVPTNTYTYFEINLGYQGPFIADTLNISFTSSNMADTTNYVGAGSTLYLDQLQIEYFPTSVKQNISENINPEIYPNPATNYVFFKFSSFEGTSPLIITDIKGSTVLNHKIQNNTSIDVSGFENGVYFYKVIADNKTLTGKLVICK